MVVVHVFAQTLTHKTPTDICNPPVPQVFSCQNLSFTASQVKKHTFLALWVSELIGVGRLIPENSFSTTSQALTN